MTAGIETTALKQLRGSTRSSASARPVRSQCCATPRWRGLPFPAFVQPSMVFRRIEQPGSGSGGPVDADIEARRTPRLSQIARFGGDSCPNVWLDAAQWLRSIMRAVDCWGRTSLENVQVARSGKARMTGGILQEVPAQPSTRLILNSHQKNHRACSVGPGRVKPLQFRDAASERARPLHPDAGPRRAIAVPLSDNGSIPSPSARNASTGTALAADEA